MRNHFFFIVLVDAFLVSGGLAAAPVLRVETPAVARLGRVEFSIQTDIAVANPYDPEQIDATVELTAPSGKTIVVPAFFHQPFESKTLERGNRKVAWLYPTGRPGWRARFAPLEAGRYSAVAVVRQNGGDASRGASVAFTVAESKERGFVRVSKSDPRYFEFDNGVPYFAIGQNVAFVKDLAAQREMIRKIGAAGGNYARVWACCEDWAMAVESRKSAWTRSWGGKAPVATIDGEPGGRLYVKISGDAGASVSCNPATPVALRPGAKYRVSGKVRLEDGATVTIALGASMKIAGGAGQWTEFAQEFAAPPNQHFLQPFAIRLASKGTAYVDGLALMEMGDAKAGDVGTNLLTDADPNQPALGVYHPVDSFILDQLLEEAEKAGVYLQLTVLPRNLYMKDLSKVDSPEYAKMTAYAKRLLRYFAARWGYSTHVISWEYFNEMDPGKPTEKFYSDLADYLDRIDPNRHLRATSDWHFPTRAYAHPRLDQADFHFYLRPPSGENWKDAVGSIQAKWAAGHAKLGSPRPLLLSEFGITDDKWQRHPELGKDAEFQHWQDGNWTAMLSGFASTAAHWYWDDIEKRDYYRLYGPVAKFAADIPWTTAKLKPAAAQVDSSLRVLGLSGTDRAYLFISDPRATWHAAAIEGKKPEQITGATVTLEGLAGGGYQVQWWNTQTGEVVQKETVTALAGLKVPAFARSIACKVIKFNR